MPDEQAFDYDATIKEINKLQQRNLAKVKALNTAGQSIDPAAVANIKMDTFIETFLDKNAQALYVLKLEEGLSKSLDDALAFTRQQQIVEGTPSSGIILPKG
jgi:hypothetical protein